ncbi:TPR-like protein [Phellopilus nigrolimitatus]|nr:TPR-like protein [Phellopilus nigrolimitatus]
MPLSLEKIERALLAGQWDETIDLSEYSASLLAQKVVSGEFKDVLTSSSVTDLFKLRISGDDLPKNPLESWFSFESSGEISDEENELLRLVIGVACLHAFVQVNWTGPDLDILPAYILLPSNSISEESLNQKAIAELTYGGEPAYHLARTATFLRLAQLLFDLPFTFCQSAAWWRLRAARIHEHILDEPVALPASLTSSLKPLYLGVASDRDLAGRLALEHGLLEHQFSQDKLGAELFVAAARHSGLEFELTGALGKRTKFQQNELSQLVLLAESRARAGDGDAKHVNKATDAIAVSAAQNSAMQVAENGTDPLIVPTVPVTLALNDDTLLEQTEFTSSSVGTSSSKLGHLDPSAQPPLHPLDQCILLSLCLNVKNTSPAHGLTAEQMSPYVARVISHPQNWSVHTMALLLRSRLEASRTRTVERSTLQLQALIDQMPTSDSSLPERLQYFHSLPLPSKWEFERELAIRFLTLGVVRSALEIFERLEMWEEAIKCWQALERPASGIAIVRDLLEGRKEESETVVLRGKAATERRRHTLDNAREAKLWCLLGDLEPQNALAHYERAWAVSGEKSGRAMRSMGGYYFTRGEFGRAIECLKKAVAINSLLSRPWFILGCSCVREERWNEARDAFARCVSLDDEDGESWNNLASVYLRMSASSAVRKADRDDGDGEEFKNECPNSDDSVTEVIPFANKLLAFRALKIGLKHSYDNWRMWTNYIIIAMDVGEFAEAARAQARVIEERAAKVGAEAVDEDLLDRLVDAVTRAPDPDVVAAAVDANSGAPGAVVSKSQNEGTGLLPRVLDLFERVILPCVSSQRIYRTYARLLSSQARWTDAVKYYLDAYRLSSAATMEKGADIGKADWLEAIGEVEEIVDVLHNFGPRAEEAVSGETEPRAGKWRMQARSIVRTFMARTRDAFEDDRDWEKLVTLQDELKK